MTELAVPSTAASGGLGEAALEGLPSVSVIVPTRDRPQLLRRAVAAILNQDYAGPVECVIVFDQSDPVDPEVAVSTTAARTVRLLRNERTPGLAGARNAGLLVATGHYVAFCDDDDCWLPTKLSSQVAVLQAQPQTRLVACGINIRSAGRTKQRLGPRRPVTFHDLLRSRIMEVNPCTLLGDRQWMINEVGLVDEGLPGSYAEDYEWLLRATRKTTIPSIPAPLVDIHWHPTSFFGRRWMTIRSALLYLLERYPEFRDVPSGYARIASQLAFAESALGERAAARHWAAEALRSAPSSPRSVAAGLVSLRLLPLPLLQRAAQRMGRGL